MGGHISKVFGRQLFNLTAPPNPLGLGVGRNSILGRDQGEVLRKGLHAWKDREVNRTEGTGYINRTPMMVCDANTSTTRTRRIVFQDRTCQEVCESALGHSGGWTFFEVQERWDESLKRMSRHCKDERILLEYSLHVFPCVHLEVVLHLFPVDFLLSPSSYVDVQSSLLGYLEEYWPGDTFYSVLKLKKRLCETQTWHMLWSPPSQHRTKGRCCEVRKGICNRKGK